MNGEISNHRMTDPLEQMHALESLFQNPINPDRAVRDNLRNAIMAIVNYGRYEDNLPQFHDWDEYYLDQRAEWTDGEEDPITDTDADEDDRQDHDFPGGYLSRNLPAERRESGEWAGDR